MHEGRPERGTAQHSTLAGPRIMHHVMREAVSACPFLTPLFIRLSLTHPFAPAVHDSVGLRLSMRCGAVGEARVLSLRP